MTSEEPGLPNSHSSDDPPQPSSVAPDPRRTEPVLTSLLKEVLALPDIDMTRHFVDLGGDSIAATRLTAGLSEAFGITFSPALPLEADTLQDMATRIDLIRRSFQNQNQGQDMPGKGGGRARGII